MKCEACAKREATVAYTHIVDDIKKTIFLCPVCAEEKNIAPPAQTAAGRGVECSKATNTPTCRAVCLYRVWMGYGSGLD